MEKFAIDLDKVLDEFELNEDRADELAAGRESRPSGYREFLLATGDNVYSCNECVPLVQSGAVDATRLSKSIDESVASASLRYDFPFEPAININLAEADFAPSSKTTISPLQDIDLASISESSDVSNQTFKTRNELFNFPTKLNNVENEFSIPTTNLEYWQQFPNRTSPSSVLTVMKKEPNVLFPVNSDDHFIPISSSSSKKNVLLNESRKMNNESFETQNKEPDSDQIIEGVEVALPFIAFVDNRLSTVDFEHKLVKMEDPKCHKPVENVDPNHSTVSTMFSDRNTVPLNHESENIEQEASCSAIVSTEIEMPENVRFSFASPTASVQLTDSSPCTSSTDSCFQKNKLEFITCQSSCNSTEKKLEFVENHSSWTHTPFETPVTSPELIPIIEKNTETSDEMQCKSKSFGVHPVKHEVKLSSTELDNCLKEVKINDKFIDSATNNCAEKTKEHESQNEPTILVENDVDGFSSGDEFYSPLLERPASQAELSNLDPVYNVCVLKPDQTYEDVNPSSVNDNKVVISSVGSGSEQMPHAMEVLELKNVDSDGEVETNVGNHFGNGSKCEKIENNILDLNEEKRNEGESFVQEHLDDTNKENDEMKLDRHVLNDVINRQVAQRSKAADIHLVKEQQNLEIKNQLSLDPSKIVATGRDGTALKKNSEMLMQHVSVVDEAGESCQQMKTDSNGESEITNIYSFSDHLLKDEPTTIVSMMDDSLLNKRQRPTSLNLSGKTDAGSSISPELEHTADLNEDVGSNCSVNEGAVGHDVSSEEKVSTIDVEFLDHAESSSDLVSTSSAVAEGETTVGTTAPFWTPDADAPNCMECNIKFTVIKRRHHCRACGRVLCSQCCASKAKLQYLDNKEARVCQQCLHTLNKGVKTRGEPKQVIFSDGIRPGGDLTDLDSPGDIKPLYRRQKRIQKKVENFSDYFFDGNPDTEELYSNLKDTQTPPVVFTMNKNLHVFVKLLNMECCVKKMCWCFTTDGMCTVGQDEIVVLLECLPDEKIIPKDIFSHFTSLYDQASQGKVITDLGHTLFTQSFLGSKDHGGFLYIRPTFQCLNQIIQPPQPYLVGVLLQKWETPWAKVFPIRLMLRLGSEFRFYPCPLISVRFRKPVYSEIGHTIMNLLADFRNYQYRLPLIRGMVIHMEEKQTFINIPRNRYDETMKALNNSNDHVLAFGGNFSLQADSHLVCIQKDEGNYQTQAINIENRPRKVTGASFVVFNGALKSSSGLTAKSSIVEDGLMVQILPDTMITFRQALREMQNFTIKCGLIVSEIPEEQVSICWTEDDKTVNVGVKSPIDGMSMDGIGSLHIHGGTDYVDKGWLIRWTEVFLIQTDENINSRRPEPVNISRLAETLAQACCIALTAHLGFLKEADLTKIGLRVTIDAENVGYEIGAREMKLPSMYMNDLDSELVPVIHRAASQAQEVPIILELIFHILEQ